MFNVLNIDVFDSDSQLIVVPISTVGSVSDSFSESLKRSKIKTSLRKKSYSLGDVETHNIGGKKPRLLMFACTVDHGGSDYSIIDRIAVKMAEATNRFTFVKSVASPLLGTGAGQLEYFQSLDIIFRRYYKHARITAELNVCIPDAAVLLGLKPQLFSDEGVSIFRIRELIIKNERKKTPRLDLGNCGIRSLEVLPELFEAKHLQELILSNEWGENIRGQWTRRVSSNKGIRNVLNTLPSQLANLTNLKTFICGGDWNTKDFAQRLERWSIRDISVLSELINLKTLNVSNNEVEEVGKMNKLVNLEKLYLNNNNLAHFPKIANLRSLKELYLSNNKLSDVSFLRSSPSLKTVDLHSNKITDLSSIRNLIGRIGLQDTKWAVSTISIASNPLINPDPEIIPQGVEKILAFFKQSDAEKNIRLEPFVNRNFKLVLVGNSHVGKSTLLHWLKTTEVKTNIPSTHWLNVDTWILRCPDEEYTVRTFDFGGQEYYHDTHHLFFTNQTIYLVLWDSKSDKFDQLPVNQQQLDGRFKKVLIQTYPLRYWLDSIKFHIGQKSKTESEREIKRLLDERDKTIKSQIKEGGDWTKTVVSTVEAVSKEIAGDENILIVQNKVDSDRHKTFIDEKSLKLRHEKIYDFFSISVTEGRGLQNLQENLLQVIKLNPLIGKPFLATWGIVKSRIESETFTKPYSLEDFILYCNNIIKEMPELKGKNQLQISSVLFNKRGAESFAQYLNNIGIVLYYPENPHLKEKIFLNQEQILRNIYQILLNLENQQGEFTIYYVIEILKSSINDEQVRDLIKLMQHFKIIFEHPSKADTYIAPLYLPKAPLDCVKLFSSLFEKPLYRYRYSQFIHKNVILDFFHRYGQAALKESAHEDYYYYWREGIILKDEVSGGIVMVKFYNGNNETQCAFVDIISLKNAPNNLFIKKIAEDLEAINQGWEVTKLVSANGSEFIPIEEIHENEKNGNWLFPYDGKVFKLIDFKNYLNVKLKMKKVFISYSKADTIHLQKLENHLSVLKRNGTIGTWNCRKLLPGEKWDGKIKKELEEADLILFLVSDDFLATDYIWDVEIKRAIERDNDPNDTVSVVPIIVRDCVWEDSPLGVYNTAPPKAQVINSSVDIDAAWTSTVKALKAIL